MRTSHKRRGSKTAAELLREYLPDKDGRSPGERLQAIAGKAFVDGLSRIEHRLQRRLSPEERSDAKATLVVSGLRSAIGYDPSLDRGTGTIPLETAFGRFAYLRMRLALIDWERKTFGDRRPGRTQHPELVEYHDELDAADGPDLEDVTASREQVLAWVRCSALDGKNLSTWIVDTLDAAAGLAPPAANRAAHHV